MLQPVKILRHSSSLTLTFVPRPTCPLLSIHTLTSPNTSHGLRPRAQLITSSHPSVSHLSFAVCPSIPRRNVPWLQRCPHSLPRRRESNSVATTGSAAVPLCPRQQRQRRGQSHGFSPSSVIFRPILEHKSTCNASRTVLYKRFVALSHGLSSLFLAFGCHK